MLKAFRERYTKARQCRNSKWISFRAALMGRVITARECFLEAEIVRERFYYSTEITALAEIALKRQLEIDSLQTRLSKCQADLESKTPEPRWSGSPRGASQLTNMWRAQMPIQSTFNSSRLRHEIIESLLQDAYGVEFLKIDGQLVFDVHAASGGVTLNRCMYLLKPLDQGHEKPHYAVTSGVEFGRFYEHDGPYWGQIFERLAISISELHKELVGRDGLVTQQRIDQQIALINLDNTLQPRVTDLDGGFLGNAVSLSTLELQPAEYTSKIDLSLIP